MAKQPKAKPTPQMSADQGMVNPLSIMNLMRGSIDDGAGKDILGDFGPETAHQNKFVGRPTAPPPPKRKEKR
jgi:hypothetical protein